MGKVVSFMNIGNQGNLLGVIIIIIKHEEKRSSIKVSNMPVLARVAFAAGRAGQEQNNVATM
jgi:hypothetical protein